MYLPQATKHLEFKWRKMGTAQIYPQEISVEHMENYAGKKNKKNLFKENWKNRLIIIFD